MNKGLRFRIASEELPHLAFAEELAGEDLLDAPSIHSVPPGTPSDE